MGSIIRQLVIGYLLEWIAGAAGSINWDEFAVDANAAVDSSIAKLVPNQWADTALDKLAAAIIKDITAALKAAASDQKDIAQLLKDCVAGNWTMALIDLEAILHVGAGGAVSRSSMAVSRLIASRAT